VSGKCKACIENTNGASSASQCCSGNINSNYQCCQSITGQNCTQNADCCDGACQNGYCECGYLFAPCSAAKPCCFPFQCDGTICVL
jgi:hypothetical protein